MAHPPQGGLPVHSPGPPDRSVQALAERALIWIGAAVYLFVLPQHIGGDAYERFGSLENLMQHGSLGASRYSCIETLLSAPLWLAGRLAGNTAFAVSFFNKLVFLLGLGAIHLLFRNRIDGRILRKLILLLMAASMFGYHVQNYNGDLLTAVLVCVGLASVAVGSETLGWVGLVLGVANAPATFGGLVLAILPGGRTARRALKVIIPLAACAALVLCESWVKRGSPFDSGYGNDHGYATVMPYSGLPGFSFPFFLGLISILFSFGKGLVFFAPGLLLLSKRPSNELPGAWKAFTLSSVLFVAGLVIVYSKWWAWYGGWSWGPRFFLFASIPASMALAVHLSDRGAGLAMKLATLVILAVSVWVGIDGAVFGQHGLEIGRENGFAQEYLVWYVPQWSALLRPFIDPKPLGARDVAVIAYFAAAGFCLAAPTVAGVKAELVRRFRRK